MARTVIDLDEDAFLAAAARLGTKTKVETVNRALKEVGERSKRLAALDRISALTTDLGNEEVMRKAWR